MFLNSLKTFAEIDFPFEATYIVDVSKCGKAPSTKQDILLQEVFGHCNPPKTVFSTSN